MLIVLININNDVLQTVLEELFDFLSNLRVDALGCLDNHLQFALQEVDLGFGRIDS
jgi:hypothetical protein